MKFVNTNQAAYDTQDIVFPGLGNCHGVVYKTDKGLFAYHIYGAPGDSGEKATLFAAFVKHHRIGHDAVGDALCGACPSNRYADTNDTKPEQLAELRLFASALGFTGSIWGASWNTAAKGWQTTYCAADRGMITAPQVRMQIEDFTNQDQHNVTGPPMSSFDHKQMTIKKENAFIGSKVMWSSTKAPEAVITGVTRKPGVLSEMIVLNKLR